eukprot:6240513-Alexandrium_andersonii.AAC.1
MPYPRLVRSGRMATLVGVDSVTGACLLAKLHAQHQCRRSWLSPLPSWVGMLASPLPCQLCRDSRA